MATENAAAPAPAKLPTEVKIVSHSSLFYWWPVWVVGVVMGIMSQFSGYMIAAVPRTAKMSKIYKQTEVTRYQKDAEGKWVKQKEDPTVKTNKEHWMLYDPSASELLPTTLGIVPDARPGVIFAVVLLLVITITNIQLRGLWSLVIIVVIVALVVILSLANAWPFIFEYLNVFDIRLSTGGYFFISGVLFAIWLIVFLLFDPQRYMIFKPGEFKVRLEIGEGETSYDTRGMTVKRERSDFFRHWILGLGSGDLIVNTTGASAHQFDLPNVLFLNQKVKLIQEMVRTHKETNN